MRTKTTTKVIVNVPTKMPVIAAGSVSPVMDNLLLENGDSLLLEDSGLILLETA